MPYGEDNPTEFEAQAAALATYQEESRAEKRAFEEALGCLAAVSEGAVRRAVKESEWDRAEMLLRQRSILEQMVKEVL